ncbi:MAG: SIS domain-containing protein [Oscillospiraceae bacterium]|jgi:phosphoheptose isomerase|nr:SIS domain-containing protein [Oscillospiraceae bacterium]
MKAETAAYIAAFYTEHPALAGTAPALTQAVSLTAEAFAAGHKLLTAGSGGSCSDAEHITGELLKSFRLKRGVDPAFEAAYVQRFGTDGNLRALEGGLPAICLTQNFPILTALLNDNGAGTVFSQLAYDLARPGDVFLAISTSGNSAILLDAMKTAAARGAKNILLSGASGGAMRDFADTAILAPATETYRVQEIHIRLYHLYCAALEIEFFS